MTQTTTIYLVRHGEVHNPDGILYGRIPGYRLSENGQSQAQAAAIYLSDKPLAAIFASPQQRAQETAGFIGQAHPHLAIQTEELLDEVHTPWEGHLLTDMEARGWDLYTGVEPPYESPADILARVRRFYTKVRTEYAGKSVAAVSHGDIVVFSFLYAMRQSVETIIKRDLPSLGLPEPYPVTASVNVITFTTPDDDEIPGYLYHRPY